jgi:hypothetical protein
VQPWGIKGLQQFIDPYIANIFAEYNQENWMFLNLYISVRRSTCCRRGFPSIIRSWKLQIQRQVFVWQMPDAVCAQFIGPCSANIFAEYNQEN